MAILYTDAANMSRPPAQADTWTRAPGVKRLGALIYRESIYTVPATGGPATADVMYLCRAPSNSILVPHLSKIVCTAMGTAFNISKIGDLTVTGVTIPSDNLDDDDRYSGVISAITAGGAFDYNYAARPAGLAGYTVTRGMWITATLGTVTTPTVGATIRFVTVFAVQS